MADQKELLTYKGRPLVRKDNLIYYGSMADKYIVMLQVLETKKEHDMDLATRVLVQLQLTDPNLKARDRVVKKSEKDGFYTALDVGCVWLERALNAKSRAREDMEVQQNETSHDKASHGAFGRVHRCVHGSGRFRH